MASSEDQPMIHDFQQSLEEDAKNAQENSSSAKKDEQSPNPSERLQKEHEVATFNFSFTECLPLAF